MKLIEDVIHYVKRFLKLIENTVFGEQLDLMRKTALLSCNSTANGV